MIPPPPAPLLHALHDRPAAPLCVGFSGGLDSTTLLHLLAVHGREGGLRAIHVHHGLHADADAWTQHCERVCTTLNVPLMVVRVGVVRDGRGLEAAAREARHAAFESTLLPGEVLALAHHRDDQAETFLLRALRASGPDGLAAMRRWREFGPGHLWRPLLDTAREDLLAYAHAHGLAWIDDPSNEDEGLDRNFLRHRVLPLLRERWPQAEATLARSAVLCAQAHELLADEDAHAFARVATADPQCLSRTRLRSLPTMRRARVIRHWIASLGLPPLPANGIERIEGELLDAREDAEALFQWHGAVVRSWRDLLWAGGLQPALPGDWRVEWDGTTPLGLPHGGWLHLEGAPHFDRPLIAHARRGGERIVLPGRAHSHTLKHVLQDLGVPPWERERLPLLSDTDGDVLAIGDLAYAASFDRWLRGIGARLHWQPRPDAHHGN
ncbi:tRNA lysidine(34) synthetase TilS [Lysobacter sp. LF1]|uniref:tRNA(Ile)-lysidine synthase n=1 Tax=Lysobacter stagni TaxID=3045172 RepID=A0ABT6XKC1_9GAMM|nr:tRNA lysidine(34) synthetase TilS [Lysobacter sp. LF1]MDI9240503.1 tRNA lysidine(34) synthetase TilS [Lysobacter sp. LF1]